MTTTGSHQRDAPEWTVHLPPATSGAGVDLLIDRSLPRRWLRRWNERPTWQQIEDIDGRWYSSTEIEARTRRLAGRLRGADLRAGDRVILSAGSSAAMVMAYIASLRAGLVVVPLNTAYTQTEVARIAYEADPAAVITDGAQRAAWIRAATRRSVLALDVEINLPESDADDVDRADIDDPALLIYTSGTTGRPKGAELTHSNLLAGATAIELAWRWTTEDHLLLALPLFHLHGLGLGINGTLAAGASLTLRPKFDAHDVSSHLTQQRFSMFFGVPAMYQRLVAAGAAESLKALRLYVSGSAPLPIKLGETLTKVTGQTPLERYGMTETMMLTSNPCDGERRLGTVGLALPDVDLRFGDDGEVQVRGPNVITGYRAAAGDTYSENFTEDGWFRTGDLGTRDSAGYLRLLGRSKEIIISGGYNIYPKEIDEVITAHPSVIDAAAFGRPSSQWGEEVVAAVVIGMPTTADEILAHAALHLARYKLPKRIIFVDKLPRNAMGKIQRTELQKLIP
jgi:malonyl-CoA/methylmalonyl-CoA synthetase